MKIPFTHAQIYCNMLPKDVRYIGYKYEYYDGHHYGFGLWVWHFYIFR